MDQQGLNFFVQTWYVVYYFKCKRTDREEERAGGRTDGRTKECSERLVRLGAVSSPGLWAPDLVHIFAIVTML